MNNKKQESHEDCTCHTNKDIENSQFISVSEMSAKLKKLALKYKQMAEEEARDKNKSSQSTDIF